jgi:predicted acetyltransferase
MFKPGVLLEPPAQALAHGAISLWLAEIYPPDPVKRWAPYYHFKIITPDGHVGGHINLRVGDDAALRMHRGHIGFGVDEAQRGHGYAQQACRALAPLARRHFESVMITCNPDNWASKRTIENLGATFLGECAIPADDAMYREGERRKLRFEWRP